MKNADVESTRAWYLQPKLRIKSWIPYGDATWLASLARESCGCSEVIRHVHVCYMYLNLFLCSPFISATAQSGRANPEKVMLVRVVSECNAGSTRDMNISSLGSGSRSRCSSLRAVSCGNDEAKASAQTQSSGLPPQPHRCRLVSELSTETAASSQRADSSSAVQAVSERFCTCT